MAEPTLTTPMILLKDGEFCSLRFTLHPLGPQDELLRRVAQEQPSNILNAFRLRDGGIAHVQLKGDLFTCWTGIPLVKLNTVFNVKPETAEIYPVFKARVTSGTTEFQSVVDWSPALIGMQLVFVSGFTVQDGKHYCVTSYLLARHKDSKETRRPPLPNIFGDGKLCMGDHFEAGPYPSLADGFQHTLDHFSSSNWNSDAMDHLTAEIIRSIYTFNKDGRQVPPPKGFDWRKAPCCYPVSSEFINDLPL